MNVSYCDVKFKKLHDHVTEKFKSLECLGPKDHLTFVPFT